NLYAEQCGASRDPASFPTRRSSDLRLRNAVMYDWGDTNDITHHATVPLSDGEEQFGILNVAAPNKQYFSDDELTLLESVAYQIGDRKNTRLNYSHVSISSAVFRLQE